MARDLVVYLKRPGGQSQFSVHLSSQSTSHPGIRAIQDWVLSHLSLPLDVSLLAVVGVVVAYLVARSLF